MPDERVRRLVSLRLHPQLVVLAVAVAAAAAAAAVVADEVEGGEGGADAVAGGVADSDAYGLHLCCGRKSKCALKRQPCLGNIEVWSKECEIKTSSALGKSKYGMKVYFPFGD